jgi:SWI/SNF-related matrix-associated actin-dependent regulator 1 of chromatin subfamily A
VSTTATRNTLEAGVRALAGVCDWAATKDDVGYNGTDAPFGHRLASLPDDQWTPAMRREAWEMLSKYRRQLLAYGIDYIAITPPPAVAGQVDARQDARKALWRQETGQPAPERSVRMGGNGRPEIHVRFPYNPEAVTLCREIPGRRWDGANKVNVFPLAPEVIRPLLVFAAAQQLQVHPDVHEAIATLGASLPPAPAPVFNGLDCDPDEKEFRLRFEKDERKINTLKARVPGREWDGLRKWWKVRAEPVAAGALEKWATEMRIAISGRASTLINRLNGEMKARLEASTAAAAELELPGFRVEPYPFQKAGIIYGRRVKRALIADDMGLGKTLQALGIIHLENLYPAVVVCPASVKLNWVREAKRCLPIGTKIIAADSSTTEQEIAWADVISVNYDLLKVDGKGKDTKPVGLLARLIARNPKAVVYDELHYAKSPKAIRTRACQLLAQGREWRLGLTGTPFVNRPSEGVSQLRILGRLNDLGGYQQYTSRYCSAFTDRYGRNTSGHANLVELNERLRATCMIRRLKKDVLTELPEKQRSIVPVEITNRAEYARAERDLIAWLMDQPLPSEIKDARVQAAMRAEHLVKLSALKQLVAKGKMEAAKRWAADFREAGEKLVVFGWHREIVRGLAAEWKAPVIDGDTPKSRRQEIADIYRRGEGGPLLCLNIQAGGTGLDGLQGSCSNVAFLELAWTPAAHDQAESRVHRIGQTAESVNCWYLIGEGTIDEDNYELLESKAKVVSAAADGIETDMGASVVDDMVARLRARGSAAA